ncbi:hypothetical protein FGG08_000487 [Glutinoglossum americanum]|uniref:ATP-dependent RNA helicase DHX8 n=1 Tax=Glutinoglossum americanum TaxID=1670608 RepID=A0A9P8L3S9_9PEZI|nr:hypothetical protein FGG08_000487 [Glutinoglossum americanum]
MANTVPYKQIRALYDDETITVYQAYSAAIALPAVKEQKLSASPDFLFGRMTWIKPSWCWMMYRSGYSYKDDRQSHILALKLKHSHFQHILSLSSFDTSKPVRVQWDPERTHKIGSLPYRSIQIGIPRELSQKLVEEWIVGIEDVTHVARGLKEVVDGEEKVGRDELMKRGLLPMERVYEVEEGIRKVLGMD